MMSSSPPELNPNSDYNQSFLEFFRLLAEINNCESLFPRECRVCGTTFTVFEEYCCSTRPKGHCFEDCRNLSSAPFMMLYRHCTCGNTLVLTLTEETFPALDSFWQMLHDEAKISGRTLQEVAADFAYQCDCYLLSLNNPCKNRKK